MKGSVREQFQKVHTPLLFHSHHTGGHPAVTGFATHGYCTPVHKDPLDIGLTIDIRLDKPLSEPLTAGHFFYANLCEVNSPDIGIVMLQPRGAISAWSAKLFLHGSSIDPRGEKNIPKGETRSVGLVILRKALMLSLSQNYISDTRQRVGFEQILDFHKFLPRRRPTRAMPLPKKGCPRPI